MKTFAQNHHLNMKKVDACHVMEGNGVLGVT